MFARVRPGVAREDGDQHCVDMNTDTGKCLVRLQDGDAVERVLAGGSAAIRTVEKEYTFDGVFDQESNQKEVYEDVGKPVLKDVLQGYNGSILAYGQTGARSGRDARRRRAKVPRRVSLETGGDAQRADASRERS